MNNMLVKKSQAALVALVIITLFHGGTYVRASEEAVGLLMRAFQHSGANPVKIRSGRADFEVQIEHRPSDAFNAILEERQQHEDHIWGMFSQYPERLEEDHRLPTPEVRNRTFELSILMLGNDIYFAPDGRSNKRRFDIRELVQFPGPPGSNVPPTTGRMQTISISMGSPNQPDSTLNIKWMPNSGFVEYSNEFEDIAEFQLFGRIRELPFSWISEIFRSKLNRADFSFPSDAVSHFVNEIKQKGLTCEIIGEEMYDGTKTAKIVEVRRNGTLLERYLIDPTRGYIVPYIFVTDETGVFSTEHVAGNFSILPGTDFYYPSLFTTTTKHPAMGDMKSIYRLVPNSLVFNQAVSEAEFAIDIPAGATVHRRILDIQLPPIPFQLIDTQETIFRAVEQGVISLAQGGYDLDSMRWLVREISPEDFVPSTGGVTGWVRWLLMSTGIILVLFGVYQIWKKRNAV